MPGTCGAVGSLAKLVVANGASPHTFSGGEAYAFVYESMATRRVTAGGRVIWGTRAERAERQVKTSYLPVGRLHLQPTPVELASWLPRILGDSVVGNTFRPAETLPSFGMLISRDNGTFQYNDCMVGQAVFRGRSGPSETGEEEIIDMVLLIYAKQELTPAEGSAAFPAGVTIPAIDPSLTTAVSQSPYIFSQGVLTLSGQSRPFDEFVLSIDNRLAPRFRNSLTPTCFLPLGRRINLQVKNPFLTTTHTDAFNSYSTGIVGSLGFTSGTCSTIFNFPHLRNVYETPTVPGKTEIPLSMNFEARATEASVAALQYEMYVVNDSTP